MKLTACFYDISSGLRVLQNYKSSLRFQ